METYTRESAAATPRAEASAAADRFLSTLRSEQARYLAAVEEARARLAQDDGQLAHVAAIQGRMSRQFFDAQRAILRRRADTDAEVARIAAETEATALALVDRAQVHALAGNTDPAELGLPDVAFDVPVSPTWRDGVAALSVSVVRSSADVPEIQAIVDDAFRSADPDGVVTERELRRVLDDWWRLTSQECTALIDDANARAAVRLHLAGVEARHVLDHTLVPVSDAEPAADQELSIESPVADDLVVEEGPDTSFAPPVGSTVIDLPAPAPHVAVVPVIAALDATDQAGLDGVLDELLDAFEVPVVPELAPTMAEPAIRLDEELPPQEAFRRFWEQGRPAHAPAPHRGWSPTRLVVPMVALSGLAVAVLAWVG